MALNFRLFNCDRTFNLDSVEALIRKVTTKLSGETKIEKSYFPLPRMSELCKELEEGGSHFDYAVFVVHAHESRLSINEKNAGIGYAKLYRVLQKVSEDRVLIVIGGDDNYKDEGERDKSLLSRWAWHKICSQFTEGYLNGAKSFIFSWEDSHNPIHEEALEFYLDPKKKGQEFVPRPKSPPPTRVEPKKVEQPKYDSSHETKKQDLQTIVASAGTDKYLQQKRTLGRQFPRGENANRSLPEMNAERKITTDKAGPLQDESSVKKSGPTYQAPRGDKASDLHIMSFHSSKESVDVVERLLQEVSKHQTIPSKPFIPHLTSPDMLSRYITDYKPRYLILVSDMEFFKDLPNLDNQVKLYQDLVKNSQDVGTKLILVVTDDDRADYKVQEKLSSCKVLKIFRDIIKDMPTGIPKTDKALTIMSWNKEPSQIHRDALTQLLIPCGGVRAESSFGLNLKSEYDSQDRRLKYKALVNYGRVVGVLKSDPPGWQPDISRLNRALKENDKSNGTIECWEDAVVYSPNEPKLLKIAEEHRTGDTPSIKVFSYHREEESNEEMGNFIHWVGFSVLPSFEAKERDSLVSDITSSNPDYVVFSADIKVLDEVKELIAEEHESYIKKIEAFIGKKVILMLFGDTSNKGGEMVSDEVKKKVHQLTEGILHPDKLMIMSWETRPYTTHQKWMKKHLNPKATKESNKSQHSVSPGEVSVEPYGHRYDQKTQGEYDHEKGYLKYKAVIYQGGGIKVLYCNPSDWQPEGIILQKLIVKYRNEKKTSIELWEKDGNIRSIEETESKGVLNRTVKCVCNAYNAIFPKKENKEHCDRETHV